MARKREKDPATCGECGDWIEDLEACGNPVSENYEERTGADWPACEDARPKREQLPAKRPDQVIRQMEEAIRERDGQIMGLLQSMADMMRITNERMAAMEQTIRTLEKVTPGQAHNINQCIRERAAELCQDYRMTGNEKATGAAIRKEIREATGARNMQGVARCDYQTVIDMILDWDDSQTMKAIRQRGGAGA